MGVSLSTPVLAVLALVMMFSVPVFPKDIGLIVAIAALMAFIVSLAQILVESMRATGFGKDQWSDHYLRLMNSGIRNPKRYRRRNHELVKAYDDFLESYDVGHSRRDKSSEHVYEAALLILAGKVAVADSHLVHLAIQRGITDPMEMLEMVNLMKSHRTAIADGAL